MNEKRMRIARTGVVIADTIFKIALVIAVTCAVLFIGLQLFK